MEITVKNSGKIAPQRINQSERGSLAIFEPPLLPFDIKRVYVIHGVTDGKAVRGGHAHKENDQAIFMLQGAVTLHLDDGEKEESVRIVAGEDGVRLGKMLWHSMSDFTPDAIAIVFASRPYEADDYLHDHEEFKKHAGTV
jgi:hypothetical protein